MCGIVGVWNISGDPVDEPALLRARDSIVHRGPDDAGMHIDGNVGLAHRRLSILDLSPAGRMPMSGADRQVWAVFNGEIYNFKSIRDELLELGHQFASTSDSEVVVRAYEEWGAECFARFNGMFAIGIWDQRNQRCVLARDAAGQKPLYYKFVPGKQLVFASTLKPIIEYDRAAAEVEPNAVYDYLRFGFPPGETSILKGVRTLAPGCYAVVNRETISHHAHFDLARVAAEPSVIVPANEDDATDALRDLIEDAVRLRLVSDVPLGAFLSSGVDSSLVVALMAKLSTSPVETYTIGFDDPRFDESARAAKIAAHLGVRNTVHTLRGRDVLDQLPALIESLDEPMADYSALPTLSVSALARKHVTVALTGDGADESFGGYRYYLAQRWFERYASVPRPVRSLLANAGGLVPNPRLRRIVKRLDARDPHDFFGRGGFYRGATCESAKRLVGTEDPVEDSVANAMRQHDLGDSVATGMLYDAMHTLPKAWLVKVDRCSMAVSLEARSPFLDRRVLEFAFALPMSMRIRGGTKKYILRRLLSEHVPKTLFDHPKQGFTAPVGDWLRNELRGELTESLSAEAVRQRGWLDPKVVTTLVHEHLVGGVDHAQLLWALLVLEWWVQHHLEGKALDRRF